MIKIFPDSDEMYRFAADLFVRIGSETLSANGRCTILLSGGSTPKALYRLLASAEYKNKIEWKSVYFFFGDERNVAPDDEESNFRMADEALFEPLNVEKSNIFRWMTEMKTPENIAADYARRIEDFFGGAPQFDLTLLGMGADGHTASLFPFSSALSETNKIAVANPIANLETTRLTVTFPVINNSRNVVFLVKGADKAEALRAVLQSESAPEKFPAQHVKPENGEIYWLIDETAGSYL